MCVVSPKCAVDCSLYQLTILCAGMNDSCTATPCLEHTLHEAQPSNRVSRSSQSVSVCPSPAPLELNLSGCSLAARSSIHVHLQTWLVLLTHIDRFLPIP